VSIPRPIFQFVEYKLRNYKANKALIQGASERRENILMRGRRKRHARAYIVSSIENVPTSGSNQTSRRVVALILEEERAVLLAPWVDVIEQTLDRMSPMDRMLIKLKYFEARYNDKGIVMQLPMSERSYYRRKAVLIGEFARAFGLVG